VPEAGEAVFKDETDGAVVSAAGWDSDVRLHISPSAFDIQYCHIETSKTCAACGVSLDLVAK